MNILRDYKNQRFNTNEDGELILASNEIAERVFKNILNNSFNQLDVEKTKQL